MIKTKNFFGIIATFIILSSCLKKEKLMVLPEAPKGTLIAEIPMGENYEKQIFFSLQGQVQKSNSPSNWDIGFSLTNEGKIITNGGNHPQFGVFTIPGADIDSNITVSDLKKYTWHFDVPDGQFDSTAFNDWCDINDRNQINVIVPNKNLYVIKLGDTNMGKYQYVKVAIKRRENGIYYIDWSYLNKSVGSENNRKVTKPGSDRNFIYYKFTTAGMVEANNEEFAKTEWDLLFTTYKKRVEQPNFPGIIIPYILRGVLINPYKVSVADVSGKITFDKITKAFATAQQYSTKLDVIGWDWKQYSSSANQYVIVPGKVYIVKDVRDQYWALNFQSFYNSNGQKGFPKIATKLLL